MLMISSFKITQAIFKKPK